MNYREAYKDYTEGGKIVYDKVPPEVIETVMQGKNALLIFFENIDLCNKTLGESPVVARMLYEIAAYDRMIDKENYKIPDFSGYKNGEMAGVVFEVMINSTKTNFKTYITKTMQSQYNGSGNSSQARWPWQRERGGQSEDD